MNIIKIGEPIVTKMGTVVTRYVENGRLYKSIDFQKSANKVAKEKSLVKSVVLYGDMNKPEAVYDTFERKLQKTAQIISEEQTKKTRGRKKGTIKISVSKHKTETASKSASAEPEITPTNPSTETPTTPKPTSTPSKGTPTPTSAPKASPKTPPSKAKVTSNKNGSRIEFIPINEDSLCTKTGVKLLKKIKLYLQRIGKEGKVPEVTVHTETERLFDNGFYDVDSKTLLSMNKGANTTHLCLTKKYSNETNSSVLLDAIFDKNGQMEKGRCPSHGLSFERGGRNIRRMKRHNDNYMPISGNDREWDCCGNRLPSVTKSNKDDANAGCYELFLEFARLYTSIFK